MQRAFVVSEFNNVNAALRVGEPTVLESASSSEEYAVVFEDDGEAGYFYALEMADEEQPIQAAVSIYDVAKVSDRDIASKLTIRWSRDQCKAGLWINDYPHAVFDFAAKRGYSRSNFPRPDKWKSHDFSWDDRALSFFD